MLDTIRRHIISLILTCVIAGISIMTGTTIAAAKTLEEQKMHCSRQVNFDHIPANRHSAGSVRGYGYLECNNKTALTLHIEVQQRRQGQWQTIAYNSINYNHTKRIDLEVPRAHCKAHSDSQKFRVILTGTAKNKSYNKTIEKHAKLRCF